MPSPTNFAEINQVMGSPSEPFVNVLSNWLKSSFGPSRLAIWESFPLSIINSSVEMATGPQECNNNNMYPEIAIFFLSEKKKAYDKCDEFIKRLSFS